MKPEPAEKLISTRREELPGGWEGLAKAVIYQACEDYRECRKKCRRYPDSRKAMAALRQVERFFSSRWFRMLADLDGPEMLRQLKKEEETR